MKLDEVAKPKKEEMEYNGCGNKPQIKRATTKASQRSEYRNCNLSLRIRRIT
jgi:hypothetical protein